MAGVRDADEVVHGRPALERRDPVLRAALLRRVIVEFEEMPGLLLTEAQAERLSGIRDDICARVLTPLVDCAVLRRDPNGAYVVNGHRP